ncbi:ImmA/IrrE family metallo-endopeptidase [Rhodanobacter sp. UC4451_H18]
MITLAEHMSNRHLTINEVSRRTHLPIDRLSLIVSGADASLSEMKKISRALKVPLSTLLDFSQDEEGERVQVLLRQTLGQRVDDIASSMAVISAQLRDILEVSSSLKRHDGWPDLFKGLSPAVDYAENFATIFRRAFASLDDQEPFPNLPQVVEELGVLLVFGRDPRVEGISAIVDNLAIILLAPRTFQPRMLFTLAHELGHLVARHDRIHDSFALMDDVVGGGYDRDAFKEGERFADAFASCLLMPAQGVYRTLSSVRDHFGAKGPLGDIEISVLARFFNVSFEVAARRCEYLDLLPHRGARALYQKISDDYGNPERRAEDLNLPPREEMLFQTSPRLIREGARLVREGRMSAGRAAELINVPISAIFSANAN